ncbi:MAG: ankyrin repeat domain-containing protein [Chitinophagales bacterium]
MKKTIISILTFVIFSQGILLADDSAKQIEAALQSNDNKKLEELFSSGTDPNIKNANGDPYCVTAAIWPEMIEAFIKAGANVNEAGKSDYSPLLMAVTMASEESVKLLIEAGADVNFSQKANGLSVLHYATWRSNCGKCIEYLIAAGANVNALDNNKETPATLMVTAMSPEERASTVHYTTNAMKNFGYNNLPEKYTNPKAEDWDSPADIMGLLLDADLDPNLKNKQGVNALMNAAYFNKVAIMDKLVKNGAKLKDKDKLGKTIWAYAIDGGAGDALVYMINNKIANVDETFTWFDDKMGINMKGMTALSVASVNGSAESIKTLLDLGAKCYSTSSGNFYSGGCLGVVKDKTPLVYAIESGKLENVKVIIENCEKPKIWQNWSLFEVRPTKIAKYNHCYGGKSWLRPWTYAEYYGFSDIADYLQKEFDTYTLGKAK